MSAINQNSSTNRNSLELSFGKKEESKAKSSILIKLTHLLPRRSDPSKELIDKLIELSKTNIEVILYNSLLSYDIYF